MVKGKADNLYKDSGRVWGLFAFISFISEKKYSLFVKNILIIIMSLFKNLIEAL